MEASEPLKRISDLFRKYRYGILVLLLGILLISFPTGQKEISSIPEAAAEESTISESSLETRLEAILSLVDGAGKVKVLLTEASGQEIIFQTNDSNNSDGSSGRQETVITVGADRNQSGLVRQINAPVYLGAVILCQGAGSAVVRLAISEAVADATNLSYDRITVLKMK